MKKTFVLDTNVLLHDAAAITSFGDNEVVLPIEVLEELDRFKKDTDEKGRNARETIRLLDALRVKGSLGQGIELDNRGRVRIIVQVDYTQAKELGLEPDVVDNRLLMTAYILKKQGQTVIFVSKDINARVKCDAIGIKSVDFERKKIDFNRLYSGWRKIVVPRDLIDNFYKNKTLKLEGEKFFPNEFVMLSDEANSKHTALARFKSLEEGLCALKGNLEVWSVRPRNKEQAMALELLLDESVWLLTLVGQAGTGKTLLALAAGLKKVVDEKTYAKMLVSRPIMPLGRDIGYLPGTKEEKLSNWMEPIFDNLEYLLSLQHKRDKFQDVEDLINSGLVQLEALTYMRGRSIPNQFIIIDEAQNLTPHEIKTVVSRAGNHTKVILTGDPYQIDNPYLDISSNGLAYCVEHMKEQEIFGHVTLVKSERSQLASLAAEFL
ncbi:MAG: PhoH family protein [Candidatus Omnitrophota bacterium]